MSIEDFMHGKISPMSEKKKDPFTGKYEDAKHDISEDVAKKATDNLNEELDRQKALDQKLGVNWEDQNKK
ncbi:MAG: hypothetical protein HZA94_01555 [Candidatus Vogelbacteria bacterium]|nr:hypothetical protein [Candidatus Vogelbacteria bacterium]